MTGLRLTAAAKLNLYLHVLGRNPDGYHQLDSLVVFAAFGDQLCAWPDSALSLQVTGPFAGRIGPAEDNLVMRAASGLARATGIARPGARIELIKQLPPASGLGGGSSDAAAALRLLSRLWNVTLDAADEMRLARSLGADVPVCLFGAPALVRGAGEQIVPAPIPPRLHVLLANPAIEMPTGHVFGKLAGRFGPVAMPPPYGLQSAAGFAGWLAGQRNDLQTPASELAPEIGGLLDFLAALPGCLLARMSGSGATCFALFAGADELRAASAKLERQMPAIWLMATEIRVTVPAMRPVEKI